MNGFLLLLFCIKILYASAEVSSSGPVSAESIKNEVSTSVDSSVSEASSGLKTKIPPTIRVSSSTNGISASPGSKPTTTIATSTISTTTTTTASIANNNKAGLMFLKNECFLLFIVSGGLILACTILLVSTLLLIWKVCQLSRHLKELSSNTDLISNTEYCIGTAKECENKSEPEAKETSMLMSDFSQTQEDMGNDTAKEEGGEVNEAGEENKKEVEATASSEEASTGDNKVETPVTVDENSSSSQPQEDTTNSHFTNAEAASFSGGTEESKDVV